MSKCVLHIFSSRDLEESSLHKILSSIWNSFICRERSKFFHCLQVEGTSTPSSIVAVNNLQSQHQRRRAPFSPQPLQPLSFLRLFDKGRSDRYEMIPPCTFLIYTSVTIHYVESFSCGIFKNNVSKTDLLRSAVWSLALFWIVPPTPNPPRTSAEDGVSTALGPGAFPTVVTKSGHKAAAHHAPLFCWLN